MPDYATRPPGFETEEQLLSMLIHDGTAGDHILRNEDGRVVTHGGYTTLCCDCCGQPSVVALGQQRRGCGMWECVEMLGESLG